MKNIFGIIFCKSLGNALSPGRCRGFAVLAGLPFVFDRVPKLLALCSEIVEEAKIDFRVNKRKQWPYTEYDPSNNKKINKQTNEQTYTETNKHGASRQTTCFLSLSFPTVANIKFPLQPHQKYYITKYEELGFS